MSTVKLKGGLPLYKNSELDLKVALKKGDKVKLNCPQHPEYHNKIVTILEQSKDYSFKVDISELPFNESMFNEGTLIR